MYYMTGLQITVGHQTLADQNLLVSDKNPTAVGHVVWTIFYRKSFYGKDESKSAVSKSYFFW